MQCSMSPRQASTSGASRTLSGYSRKCVKSDKNRTILVISHQERILNIADEIVVLADGKILKQGSKDEILPDIIGTQYMPDVCAKME